MKRMPFELLLGGALTAVGVLILLLNLGVFGAAASLIWALLFGAGGFALLGVVVQDRAHWWALIPGTTLLSLGLLIALTLVAPTLAASWGGALVLGGIGTGFCAVYLLRRSQWWAIIPAGTLLSLAIIAGLSGRLGGSLPGVVLFGGLALTFALVAIAPPGAPRRWALFPAGGLLALAALILANSSVMPGIVGPTLLILFGLALLYRASRRSERGRYEDTAVSQPH
jgi:hypothetical protein